MSPSTGSMGRGRHDKSFSAQSDSARRAGMIRGNEQNASEPSSHAAKHNRTEGGDRLPKTATREAKPTRRASKTAICLRWRAKRSYAFVAFDNLPSSYGALQCLLYDLKRVG